MLVGWVSYTTTSPALSGFNSAPNTNPPSATSGYEDVGSERTCASSFAGTVAGSSVYHLDGLPYSGRKGRVVGKISLQYYHYHIPTNNAKVA